MLRRFAVWKELLPLRDAWSEKRQAAAKPISAIGHSPEKASRVIRPPMHVHDGKRKLPISKLSASNSAMMALMSPGSSKP